MTFMRPPADAAGCCAEDGAPAAARAAAPAPMPLITSRREVYMEASRVNLSLGGELERSLAIPGAVCICNVAHNRASGGTQ